MVVLCVGSRLVANGVVEMREGPTVVGELKNEPSLRVSRKSLRNDLMVNIRRRRYGGHTLGSKIRFQTSQIPALALVGCRGLRWPSLAWVVEMVG